METDFKILDDSGTPLCPNCKRSMVFKRAIPRFAGLPELRTYECTACHATYTGAVEPGEHADLAWFERPESRGAA